MRSSSGGWVEISDMKPLPPLIFIVASCGCELSTSALFCARRCSAAIMLPRPAIAAPPASARNSRARENQATTTMPSMLKTMSKTMVETKNTRCEMRSSTSWRMMLAMTREKKIENALTTPWTSVMVTMSPLPMWLTSCARTPATSSRDIERSRPDDTATRLRFLLGPVAKALTSGES